MIFFIMFTSWINYWRYHINYRTLIIGVTMDILNNQICFLLYLIVQIGNSILAQMIPGADWVMAMALFSP